jgi:two-component system chemotaxis response regulator CheB
MPEQQGHDLVVVGASAGGIEALIRLVSQLPGELPAAVMVVLHVSAGATSALPAILARNGPLPCGHPRNGEQLLMGRIYVAPPDHHMIVKPGRVLLTGGPRENRVRPAIDALFRSAAVAYGPRVIGVVMTGYLDDGAAGLLCIRRGGGLAVVQDPADAQCPAMPQAALDAAGADYMVKLQAIGSLIYRLVRTPVTDDRWRSPTTTRAEMESSITMEPEPGEITVQDGIPTALACPDCGGGLVELKDGALRRFRCYLGHAYSPESLLDAQREEVERAIWVALRVLEERASMLQNLAQASEPGGRGAGDKFVTRATEFRQHAEKLRDLLK